MRQCADLFFKINGTSANNRGGYTGNEIAPMDPKGEGGSSTLSLSLASRPMLAVP